MQFDSRGAETFRVAQLLPEGFRSLLNFTKGMNEFLVPRAESTCSSFCINSIAVPLWRFQLN